MYIHDFDVAFCVKSNVAEWEDLAPSDVLSSLRRRVAELTEEDVLEAVGFLNTISVDGPQEEVGMPGGNGVGSVAMRPVEPKLPVGTRILSIFGESSDTDEEIDVQTGPNAVGTISQVLAEQEHCYWVEFPCGVCVFISDEELADSHHYRVLEGVSDVLPIPETGDDRQYGGEEETP